MLESENVQSGIEASADQKQAVLQELFYANQMRRDAKLPLYDLQHEYQRKLAVIIQNNYRQLLEPYIQSCLADLPVLYGFSGRMKTQIVAEQTAAPELYEGTGIKPPMGAFQNLTARLVSSSIKPSSAQY